MIIKTSFIALLLFIFSMAGAQTKSDTRLSDYLSMVKAAGFSGQIAVYEKGKLIKIAAGYADMQPVKKNQFNTVFNIASLSKQFTGVAILKLIEEGRLKGSDSIGRFFPQIPVPKSGLTIDQLLSHQSALPRSLYLDNEIVTADEWIKKVSSAGMDGKPGEEFRYSNTGYQMLALIIEVVSGTSYETFVRKNIFEKAGMNNTCFYGDSTLGIDQSAVGYDEFSELSLNKTPGNYNGKGSSNILSTASDLVKWIMALQQGKIVSQNSLQKMYGEDQFSTSAKEGYRFGFFSVFTKRKKLLLYHTGDLPGFRSELRWYPTENRIIVVLSNQEYQHLGFHVRKISSDIAQVLSGENLPVSFKNQSIVNDNKFIGEYRTSNGSSVLLFNTNGHLQLGVKGQEAINMFRFKSTADQGKAYRYNAKTDSLIHAVMTKDDSSIIKLIGKGYFDFFGAGLKQKLDAYKKSLGTNSSVEITGTVPVFFEDSLHIKTYANLAYEDGVVDGFFIGWNNGKMYDMTFNDHRPYPLLYNLIPQSQTDFIAYDMSDGDTHQIKFQLDKKGDVSGIFFSAKGMSLFAKKIR